MELVRNPKVWHPDEIVRRKGCLLVGVYREHEDIHALCPAIGNEAEAYEVDICERSLNYYDHGIGALEYVFEFRPRRDLQAFEAHLCNADFWRTFKADIIERL
jgi:hypothetical protein